MKASSTNITVLNFLIMLISEFIITAALPFSHHPSNGNFLKCLTHHYSNAARMSRTIYTPATSSYSSIFQMSSANQRIFSDNRTRKPVAIITPFGESQIQNVIFCCRKYGVQMRIRGGGHDYEGLSSVPRAAGAAPTFVILDLRHLRSISIDEGSQVAWVGGGATIGEFYYALANAEATLAFSAGLCPTVGVGGHFSGGGYGMLSRKFGLSADNIIDAKIIDAKGRVLNRTTMGEDPFWAIRGGGASSFGVVTAWKLKLSIVPKLVTVFTVTKTGLQNTTRLIHQWQYVANKIDRNLSIRVSAASAESSETTTSKKRTIQASFFALFLGRTAELIPLMREHFPELGLAAEDCIEMSWGESLLYFTEYYHLLGGQHPLEALLNRTSPRISYKGKSDFVQKPIPQEGIRGILKWLLKDDQGGAVLSFEPLGGRLNEISESETPYPYRSGYIYAFDQLVIWDNNNNDTGRDLIRLVNGIYKYMTPYVSNNPRGAYYNSRDLDLGVNNIGHPTSYKEASVWGFKYFKNNFERLARVKFRVDPQNFFMDEQSIPPLVS